MSIVTCYTKTMKTNFLARVFFYSLSLILSLILMPSLAIAQAVTQPTETNPPASASASASAPAPAPVVTTTAPSSSSASAPADDDIVQLSAFTVTSSADKGYIAQNTLAGSRLKTSLMDVAAPTSVFTEQFLQDLQINNTDDLIPYMLSAENIDDYENAMAQNAITDDTRALKFRGLPGGTVTVNFFLTNLRFDSFSIERVEQSRGPNAILFGVGSPGGLINVTTKRADTHKMRTQIFASASSYNGRRIGFDFNTPLGYQFHNKVAIRIAAVRDNTDTWRDFEYNNNKRYFGTVKWQIGPKTELNIEGETGALDKASKRTYIAYDGISRWQNAVTRNGLTGNARFFDNLLNSVGGTAYVPPGIGTGPNGFSNVTTQGWNAASSALAVANRANFDQYGLRFQFGGGITGAANPGNGYPVYNFSDGNYYNMSGQLAAGMLVSPENLNIALTPGATGIGDLGKSTIIYGPGFWQKTDYSRITATFNHQFGQHLSLEAAAFRLTSHRDVMDLNSSSNLFLNIDIDPTFPNGAPNPNVGRPYFDSTPQRSLTSADNKAARVSLAYDNDYGKWGHHRLAGVVQVYQNLSDLRRYHEGILNNPYTGNAAAPTPNNSANALTYRTYLGLPVGDPADHNWTLDGAPIVMNDWRRLAINNPVTIIGNDNPNAPTNALGRGGASGLAPAYLTWIPYGYTANLDNTTDDSSSTSAVGPKKTTGTQTILVLQSDFWQRRINTIIGYSLESINYRTANAGYVTQLDHYDPNYANNYDWLNPDYPLNPGQRFTAHNASFSLVYHATPWLALTYNFGQNVALPYTDGRILGTLPDQAKGRTQDIGVKLSLLQGRLFLSAVYFDTKVTNDYGNIGIKNGDYNPIWNAVISQAVDANGFTGHAPRVDNATGQILISTDPGYNDPAASSPYVNHYGGGLNTNVNYGTGYPGVTNNGTLFNSRSRGVELELVANLTDNLRIFANFNQSQVTRSDIGAAMIDYINTWHRTWTDNAPMLLNPTLGGPAAVASTVGELVRVIDQKTIIGYLAQEGETPPGQSLRKANIRFAYDFSTGPLRGFTLLGGVRYQGPLILAYTVATDGPPNNVTDIAPNYNPVDANGNIIAFNEDINPVTHKSYGFVNVTRDAAGNVISTTPMQVSGKRKVDGPDNYFLDLGAAYKFKWAFFGLRSTMWTVQLNVKNVFNNSDVIPIQVSALSGQMTSYRINDPISWVLSMRVNF